MIMKKLVKIATFIGGLLSLFAITGALSTGFLQHTYASMTHSTINTQNTAPETRIKKAEPISILLTGLDSGALMYEKETTSRTDAIIIATLNPKTKRTTLTSIPRDTWMPIDDEQTFDKVNHAYVYGGLDQTKQAIENYLGIPIDYTVSVDMKAFIEGVDALGGLEITPNQTFSQDGSNFEEGNRQTFNGEEAMNYARMRKQDEKGEMGRQERQRQVINEMMAQYLTLSTIKNVPDMIKLFNEHVETNLDFSDIVQLFLQYQPSLEHISSVPFTQYRNVTLDGTYYLHIDDMHRNTIHKTLIQNLEINQPFNPIIYPLEQIPEQSYFITYDRNQDGMITNQDAPVPFGLYAYEDLQHRMAQATGLGMNQ